MSHDKLQIIYENDKPHGIRDENGFLFFFPKITEYSGQKARYLAEIDEQDALANYLLESLQKRM